MGSLGREAAIMTESAQLASRGAKALESSKAAYHTKDADSAQAASAKVSKGPTADKTKGPRQQRRQERIELHSPYASASGSNPSNGRPPPPPPPGQSHSRPPTPVSAHTSAFPAVNLYSSQAAPKRSSTSSSSSSVSADHRNNKRQHQQQQQQPQQQHQHPLPPPQQQQQHQQHPAQQQQPPLQPQHQRQPSHPQQMVNNQPYIPHPHYHPYGPYPIHHGYPNYQSYTPHPGTRPMRPPPDDHSSPHGPLPRPPPLQPPHPGMRHDLLPSTSNHSDDAMSPTNGSSAGPSKPPHAPGVDKVAPSPVWNSSTRIDSARSEIIEVDDEQEETDVELEMEGDEDDDFRRGETASDNNDGRKDKSPSASVSASGRRSPRTWNATRAASARQRRYQTTETCKNLEDMLREPSDGARISRTALLSRALRKLTEAKDREVLLQAELERTKRMLEFKAAGDPVDAGDAGGVDKHGPNGTVDSAAVKIADSAVGQIAAAESAARASRERERALEAQLREARERETSTEAKLAEAQTTLTQLRRKTESTPTATDNSAQSPRMEEAARERERSFEIRIQAAEEENRRLKSARLREGMERERALEDRLQDAQEELVRLRGLRLAEGRDREHILESRLHEAHGEIERLKTMRLHESINKEQRLQHELAIARQEIRDLGQVPNSLMN